MENESSTLSEILKSFSSFDYNSEKFTEENELFVVGLLNTHFPTLEKLNSSSEEEKILSNLNDYKLELHSKEKELEAKDAENSKMCLEKMRKQIGELKKIQNDYKDISTNIKEKSSVLFQPELLELSSQIHQLLQVQNYLNLVIKIEDCSNIISQSNNPLTTTVPSFLELVKICDLIHEYKVDNLFIFCEEHVTSSFEIILKKTKENYFSSLKTIQWPIPFDKLPTENRENQMKQFQEAFSFLLSIQLSMNKKDKFSSLWAFDMLIEPLEKRFKFHFQGNKVTNKLEKPEWYFVHVLTLINSHAEFLIDIVQKCLDNYGIENYDAIEEFIKGLIKVVNSKLDNDIFTLLKFPEVFYHTVNEALAFQRNLKEIHDFPPGEVFSITGGTCITSFTEHVSAFNQWILEEKNYAFSKFSESLSSPNCWELKYSTVSKDDLKITECSDNLITILFNISERYKFIPSPEHQKRFIEEIQKPLLDRFYDKIAGEIRIPSQFPYHTYTKDQISSYSLMLTSLFYCETVLIDWGEQTFYIELSKRINAEPFVFQKQISNLKHLKQVAFEAIIDVIFHSFKSALKNYFKSLRVVNEARLSETFFDLSPQIADSLSLLKEMIYLTKETLSTELFEKFWGKVASQIDEYFFKQILAQHAISEYGKYQFDYDMRPLLLLFGIVSTNPENLFKFIHDICVIWKLPKESRTKLKKLVSDEYTPLSPIFSVGNKKESENSPVQFSFQSLEKFNILHIHNKEQIKNLLNF